MGVSSFLTWPQDGITHKCVGLILCCPGVHMGHDPQVSLSRKKERIMTLYLVTGTSGTGADLGGILDIYYLIY